jgi:LPS export ABC transporter protein LptC
MRILISFILIFLIAGCGEKKVRPAIDSSLQVSKLPAQESWGDTVFFSDSGRTKAVLVAGHLRVYDKPDETLLDSNIKVTFLNPKGERNSVLTAKRGKVNNFTKDLYAIDSVVAVSDSGDTIRTQELMWRNKDKKILSDKFVTIVSPKEKIQGYGFESDQSMSNYTIYNITYETDVDSLKSKKQGKSKK